VKDSLVLDIGDVGGGRIQGNSEQVELEGLFLSLGGSISASFSVCGGVLGLHEVLDLLNLLPGLGTLLICAVVIGRLILYQLGPAPSDTDFTMFVECGFGIR
jgi:hypothetical protein